MMKSYNKQALSLIFTLCLVALLTLFGCSQPNSQADGGPPAETEGVSTSTEDEDAKTTALTPAALPTATEGSGVDENINQETIDNYLDREDVVYRDVRMLYDPANFGEGTESNLTATIKGFKVVPVVYLANVPLPLEGLYSGPALYAVEWDADGQIVSATANYQESEQIIRDLFPQDKAVFLQCGAGVYAGFAKQLLIHLGYDADSVYNIGGNWSYTGNNTVTYALPGDGQAGQGTAIASWKADYAYLDFALLHAKQG
jgi:rhodanese-related sulfurtransferase